MATPSALVPAAPATSASTPDVFRDGRFSPNDWTILADDAALPAQGGALLPFARALGAAANGELGNLPVGVVVGPADRFDELKPHLDRFAVVAIDFPKYSDGRGFSQAALVARAGFAGEVRAIGNVLIDQIAAMKRLGISAFEVRHATTRRYLEEGRNPSPALHYQPAVRAETRVAGRAHARRSG